MEMLTLFEGNGQEHRRRTINVASEFDRFTAMIRPLMEEKKVSLDTSVPKDGMLRVEMRPELFL